MQHPSRSSRTVLVALLLAIPVALQTACKGCGDDSGEIPTGLLEQVPADAKLVALIDLEALSAEMKEQTPFSSDRWSDLDDELGSYFEDKLGVNLLEGEKAVLWMVSERVWGGYVEGDFDGDFKGETEEIDGQAAMFFGGVGLTVTDDALLIGSRGGLRRAIALAGGDGDSLDDGDAALAELIDDSDQGGVVLVAASADLIPIPGLPASEGLSAASLLAHRDHLQARVRMSSSSEASQLKTMLDSLLRMGLGQLSEEADEATEGPFDPEGVSAIMVEHFARGMAEDNLSIDADGEDVVIDLSIEGFQGANMMLLSAAAATSIPAFLRYQRRAESAEATVNLRRLADSAVVYYEAERVTPNGTILPPQFPASVDRTPASVPCGEALPYAGDWEHPTWQALDFALSDPHRFSYQFESAGTGDEATFTAYAFGDLDCDGDLSTYERGGRVDYGTVDLEPMFSFQETE